jgi:uncharacterized cupredoxin-like copper-binding protein
MKMRRISVLLILALALPPVLAACGPSKVDVALTTYKIAPSKSSISAGPVTFHIHNDATDLTHEFVVFKTDLPEDQLPLNAEGIVDEEAEGLTLIDEAEEITPGTSKDLTVTLEAGNYVLVCNTNHDQMHYTHGMHTAFTVK